MQQVSKEVLVDSITLTEQVIVVNFQTSWFQEDIPQLQQGLLSLIDSVHIQEKVIGADRESIRFYWQVNYYYILNFDYYSQSCWFEPQDELSSEQQVKLLALLQQGIK